MLMNREPVTDVHASQTQLKVVPLEVSNEYVAPEQDDDSRRAFFRTLAGTAGALAIHTAPGAIASGVASHETAAVANEVVQGSKRARQILSLGSTATGVVSRESSIAPVAMSRRAILPAAGAIALSSVPRTMRIIKSGLRSAMWNS